MYFVYVLRNPEGRRYVGQTEDLKRRLMDHQTGLGHYTKNRGPWELVYSEEYETRSEAMNREKFLKTGRGRVVLKSLLVGRADPPEAD